MKNLLTVLIFILISSVSAFSLNTTPTNGGESLAHNNAEISFTMKSQSSIITDTNYDTVEQFFTIKAEKTINFLQVVNAKGDVDYLLPIGAKTLNLSMADFAKGTYRINLLVEGETKYVTTELVKKF